jgi:hypothetical protein
LSLAADSAGRSGVAAINLSRLARAALTILFCAVLAPASVHLQGFEFGIDNNVFHVPIVLRWYDLPQFSHDPVIQSLRHYATPVFPLLGLFTDASNIAAVFHAAFLLTRALTIFALLAVMRSFGLRGPWLAVAGAASIFVSALYGETAIGRDELLVDIFTHTALAQAVALLSIAALVRGKLTLAAIATGLTFDLNAMVGIWMLAPLGLVLAVHLRKPGAWRTIVRAGAAFSATALAVALWIALSQKFSAPAFDYRSYLQAYYPYHFFIGWADWPARIALLLQLASGFLAATLLPRHRANAALILLALAVLFGAGVVVGQTSHSRLFLNLHLLRADGMLTWMAVPLVLTASVAALARKAFVPAIGAIVAVAGLIAADWRLVLFGLLLQAGARLMARRQPGRVNAVARQPLLLAAIGAASLLALATQTRYSAMPAPPGPHDVPSDQQLAGLSPRAPEWREVTRWAEAATPPDALFIIPPKLDFVAPRRIWVDWKEGAAVMWAPDIYATWHARSMELSSLRSAPAVLAYACRHHIDYAVFDRRPGRALTGTDALSRPLFVNRWFAVFRVPACREAGRLSG